jgi:rhodanese-related sulfurtransferase
MNRMSVQKLDEHLKTIHSFQLIDVRETWEHEICHLPNSVLVPLSRLPRFLADADSGLSYIFICHHGIRSARATAFALANGFEHVFNLTGGVAAWSASIDPQFPVY